MSVIPTVLGVERVTLFANSSGVWSKNTFPPVLIALANAHQVVVFPAPPSPHMIQICPFGKYPGTNQAASFSSTSSRLMSNFDFKFSIKTCLGSHVALPTTFPIFSLNSTQQIELNIDCSQPVLADTPQPTQQLTVT